MLQGRGAFKLRFPGAGRHVEFDWSRQVLVLADRRQARRVYHSSSGAPATPTVFGTFRFYRKDYGTNAKGMVHSNYFIGGYAIHGYPSVPNYPGQPRLPARADPQRARHLQARSRWARQIFVYR